MSASEPSDMKPDHHVMQKNKTTANLLGKIAVVAITIAVIVGGTNYWRYSSAHASTDDAYLTADIITIAPQVSGTVKRVYMTDNQHVQAGQLIAVLDDSTYKTSVQQAEANLDVAIAAAQASGVNVGLTNDTGMAQIQQSEAGANQAESAIGGSEADVARNEASVMQASANAKGVQANITVAKSAIISAQAQQRRADAAIEAASAQVETAETDVNSATAALETAEAVYTKAVNDNARYKKLLSDNVIGTQVAEQAAVGEQIAKSQLQTAQQHLGSTKSSLNAKKADLRAAKEQTISANATINQAQAQYAAAQELHNAALAGVTQARAQLVSSGSAVLISRARHTQALAMLTQAQTAPKQVAMSQAAAHQASARVSQARAALADAKLRLSYTRITAPVAGIVSKRSVNEGVLVQPGMPLMAIVPPPSQNIWVVANFKETQMAKLRPGQSAEIKVDSLAGQSFAATVNSIASGTGATFALLPPDNASGNFTKVVQRIPVKLTITPDQRGIDRLHAGMSVTAVITTQ